MQLEPIHLLTLLVAVGVGIQWVAARLRLPALLLLLITGIALGPGFGVVRPDEQFGRFQQALIGLAVAVILFEGGLSLEFREARFAGRVLARLIISGLVVGFGSVMALGVYVGGLSPATAAVLGAILVVTGPTVILPMLRSSRISLRPATLLKWEGIVNDPLGALLAVLVVKIATATGGAEDATVFSLVAGVGMKALIGGAIGVVAGLVIGYGLNHGMIAEHMKNPVMLGAVLVVYTVSEEVGKENGLFAVTAMGLVLANLKNHSIEDIRRFKEQIGTMLVAFLFLILSARLETEQLTKLLGMPLVLIATVLFTARPLVVWCATLRSGLPWQERALVGWIAPRGIVAAAVAGAFEQPLLDAGYEDADLLVPIVFGVIISTVVLHGLSIRPLSRKLGLGFVEGTGIMIVGAQTWGVSLAQALTKAGAFVVLADSRYQRVSHARREGMEVHYGDVLSEEAAMVLPLERVSWVLAATDDDAYNSLVSMSFAHDIGRHHSLQVTPSTLGTRKETAHAMVGYTPWGDAGTYVELSRRYWRHGSFKVTSISEEFGWEALQERNPGALFLFYVEAEKLYAIDGKRAPTTGSKVVYLTTDAV